MVKDYVGLADFTLTRNEEWSSNGEIIETFLISGESSVEWMIKAPRLRYLMFLSFLPTQ
jgi:hypothetical protein